MPWVPWYHQVRTSAARPRGWLRPAARAGCGQRPVPGARRAGPLASARPARWSAGSAVRVGAHRAHEGADRAGPDRAVLGVLPELVAVVHVAELPDAAAADYGLRPERIEVAGALGWQLAPRLSLRVAVRVELGGARVGHEGQSSGPEISSHGDAPSRIPPDVAAAGAGHGDALTQAS